MHGRVQTLDEYLPPIADDTEEAPWMVLSMAQFQSIDAFYDALSVYGYAQEPPWLVASLLPVCYRPNPSSPRKEKLAPDVMVAFVPPYLRDSYDVEREGKPPAFVLEVVSAESRERDLRVKPRRYERMGVQEYALFAPRPADARSQAPGRRPPPLLQPPLQGYRRDDAGRFTRWEPDASGRLQSEVLGMWLVVKDGMLRAQLPDGSLLMTHVETEAARLAAEEELARLRAELERSTQ